MSSYDHKPSSEVLQRKMPDSQSREPGFEFPLLLLRSFGIFVLYTVSLFTQLYKSLLGFRQCCEFSCILTLIFPLDANKTNMNLHNVSQPRQQHKEIT